MKLAGVCGLPMQPDGTALTASPISPINQPAGEQELKFHVPRTASLAFRQWLDLTFQRHSRHAVSTICTIYYDTPEGISFLEKAASDYHKTKYRVRWYADGEGRPLTLPAFVEVKEKHGVVRRKYRQPIAVPAAELMTLPFHHPTLMKVFQRHLPEAAPQPPARLRPVLELRYRRHRYRHPLFRETFCLDSDIRCVRTHGGSLPAAQGLVLPHDVFEQKGLAQDPLPLLQALPRFGARRASLSKYFLTVLQLLPHSRYS